MVWRLSVLCVNKKLKYFYACKNSMAQMKNQYNFGIFSVNMEEKISTSGTHVVGNLPIESILRVYRA